MTYRTRILTILLAASCCSPGFAQSPPADESTAETPAEAPAADDSADAEATEEMPAEGTPEIVVEDPATLVEEDPAVAASAEEEFNPDEEISEDYPVPLPSDI